MTRNGKKALSALVITDLEGISGVSTIEAIPTDSPLYPDACEKPYRGYQYGGRSAF